MPSGTPGFAVLGDAPYNAREIELLERVIDEINAQALDFVVHVGDIGSSTPAEACGDAWLEARKRQLARLRHRLVVIPGDNEWSDCARHGIDPLARLEKWRGLFCPAPGEFCEHRRWEAHGWVFATLNVPGHNNNAGRAENAPRMREVMTFLAEAARLGSEKKGLVLFMHANPFDDPRAAGFAALREELAALGRRMPGRVVVIHGDTHLYKNDEPLPGVRRIEVWGSPFMRWTQGAIHPEGLRFRASGF